LEAVDRRKVCYTYLLPGTAVYFLRRPARSLIVHPTVISASFCRSECISAGCGRISLADAQFLNPGLKSDIPPRDARDFLNLGYECFLVQDDYLIAFYIKAMASDGDTDEIEKFSM
jgi:hypothetical protein